MKPMKPKLEGLGFAKAEHRTDPVIIAQNLGNYPVPLWDGY